MDELSYSLYGAGSRTAIKILAAILMGIPALGVLIGGFWGDIQLVLCGLVGVIGSSVFVWFLRYLSKSTKLRISDQGLVKTAVWSKPICMAWHEIRSVSTREERLSLSRSRQTVLEITDIIGQVLVISSSVTEWEKLVSTLKGKLPKEVWQ